MLVIIKVVRSSNDEELAPELCPREGCHIGGNKEFSGEREIQIAPPIEWVPHKGISGSQTKQTGVKHKGMVIDKYIHKRGIVLGGRKKQNYTS